MRKARFGDGSRIMSGEHEQLEPVRCPYCVQGNEFRVMTDLSGDARSIFYCASCRHLVRTAEADFQCLCPGCMSLRSPAQLETRHAAPTAGKRRLRDRHN